MLNQDQDLREYYNKRALEYERIYRKPERQKDLERLKNDFRLKFTQKNVLEVACGTGYWTEEIAKSAKTIVASDQSAEVLEVAKSKKIANAEFIQDDAFVLSSCLGDYDAGFAGFWWSHIPISKLKLFLESFHSKCQQDATVVFIDNIYVEGSSTPIHRRDDEGNTYQFRPLNDGSVHEVLKNFPTLEELKHRIQSLGLAPEVTLYDYYWMLEYKL